MSDDFSDNSVRVYAWAIDFIRALDERPIIIKYLIRFIFGRYAYREFLGMIEAIKKNGSYIFTGYSLENQEYHKDKMPVKWWEDE